MQVTVSPAIIHGAVTANPSKSAMQRAVAAALLAKGKSIIRNPGLSNDCLAALEVAENLLRRIAAEDSWWCLAGGQPICSAILYSFALLT